MSYLVGSNTITNIAEAAIVSALEQAILPATVPIFAADESDTKPPMPYIFLHVDNYEEVVAPGSGIFKLDVSVTFRSHVKADDVDFRTGVCDGINDLMYNSPAVTLSLVDGFHVYGFIPVASGAMAVNTDLKSYDYVVKFSLVCMPRNNA
jgi:hypothetical protein